MHEWQHLHCCIPTEKAQAAGEALGKDADAIQAEITVALASGAVIKQANLKTLSSLSVKSHDQAGQDQDTVITHSCESACKGVTRFGANDVRLQLRSRLSESD